MGGRKKKEEEDRVNGTGQIKRLVEDDGGLVSFLQSIYLGMSVYVNKLNLKSAQ